MRRSTARTRRRARRGATRARDLPRDQRGIEAADLEVVGLQERHIAGVEITTPKSITFRDPIRHAIEQIELHALEQWQTPLRRRQEASEHDTMRSCVVGGEMGGEEFRTNAHIVVENDDDPATGLQNSCIPGGRRSRVRLAKDGQRERKHELLEHWSDWNRGAVVDDDDLELVRRQRLLGKEPQ